MNWTTDLPKVDGFYWMRMNEECNYMIPQGVPNPLIVYVREYYKRDGAKGFWEAILPGLSSDGVWELSDAPIGTKWCGPLEIPLDKG